MRIIIQKDYDGVSAWVAAYIKRRMDDYNDGKGPTAARPFVIGLPTGSSPVGTYKALIEFHRRGELSFEHVVSFNMDEYCGIPRTHPESPSATHHIISLDRVPFILPRRWPAGSSLSPARACVCCVTTNRLPRVHVEHLF